MVSSGFKYRFIAMGGTFDHIHRGHKALLHRAFETGEAVFIGLTSDAFARREGKIIDQSFEERKKNLESYLRQEFPNRRYEISKLEDRFGPAIFSDKIDAIAVSSETFPAVEAANRKRRELGLQDLKAEVVPMIIADDGTRISSTRIRSGEINAEGNLVKKEGQE